MKKLSPVHNSLTEKPKERIDLNLLLEKGEGVEFAVGHCSHL